MTPHIPGRTVSGIRSKRRRFPRSGLICAELVTSEPLGEKQWTAESKERLNEEGEKTLWITEYVTSLLSKSSVPKIRETKADP